MTSFLRRSYIVQRALTILRVQQNYFSSYYGHSESRVRPRNPFYDPGYEESVWGPRPRCMIGRKHLVTMAEGLGMGSELMEIVRRVFLCANAPVDFEVLDMGENSTDDDLDNLIYSVERNGVGIKSNIEIDPEPGEMPRSYLVKRALNLRVNLIEIKSYPGLMEKTRMKTYVDVVLARLNSEGAYAQLEHDTGKGIENLRVTTEHNTRRLAEFAFDYAVKNKRRKVTLIYNKGIMNWAEGTIVSTVSDVATHYPEIPFHKQSMKAFIFKMRNLAFNGDVIVTAPLYGGLIMNILFGMTQGSGLYCAQNIGPRYAMFEPAARNKGRKMVGKDVANPLSALTCGVKLLRYLDHHETADRIQRAIELTVNEDKVHTVDMLGDATTSQVVANVERRIREIMPEGYGTDNPLLAPLLPALH